MREAKRMTVLVFICCSFIAWSATLSADQAVLKNGDRLTGAIIKMDDKNLVIKTDALGVATVARDQVETITTDKPVYIVLQDGKTLLGALNATDGKVEVRAADTTITVKVTEIAGIRNADEQKAYERLVKPGWSELWTGIGTVGLAGTAGNSETLSFTVAFNAARATRTDKTSLYFNAVKASALTAGKSEETARAVRGGIAYDHNVGKTRLFFNVFNDNEYDKFQDLDLRFVIGGGAGFHAVQNARHKLDLLAGFDYNHSKFGTPLTRNSGELYWGNEYALQLSAATSLVQSFRMFDDLSDTGLYRVNFDVSLATKLSGWLTWNLSFSDRYLSEPAPGRKSNDVLYTTGVGITFGK